MWKAFREKQINSFKPEHYYLAQIALEIFRGRLKNPRKAKLEQFLLSFNLRSETPKLEQLSEEEEQFEREKKLVQSKNHWFGLVGMFTKGDDKKKKTRKPPPKPQKKKKGK